MKITNDKENKLGYVNARLAYLFVMNIHINFSSKLCVIVILIISTSSSHISATVGDSQRFYIAAQVLIKKR